MEEHGMPFVTPEKSAKTRWPYRRHLRIPEVGEKGQLKLLKKQVLWSALEDLDHLRASIWRIRRWDDRLVDYDVVD